MLIFFQIQFVIAQWQVYYSSFNRPSLLYCSDDTCPFGFKQNQSSKIALYRNCTNPKGTALILQDSQMSTVSNYQYYTQNSYSYNHTIVFDVYYISQWYNDALIFEYKNQAYQFIYSTQNPLKFENGACDSEYHEVRTYQISLPYTNQYTNIKFSLTNNLTKALIRNIHFSYISCHLTCKTCTGYGFNECTSYVLKGNHYLEIDVMSTALQDIQIVGEGTYYSSIYYDGTQYIGNNIQIFYQSVIVLSGCQTAKAVLLYTNLNVEQGSFTFSIKGNSTSANFGWYLTYALMSSANCPVYCLKCDKDYFCSQCQIGFKTVSDGYCVTSCPKASILQNNNCIKYDQVTKYSKYLIQQFYDFIVPDNIKSSFVLESSTSKDFQKGDEIYWSYIDSNVVYGGKYVWATARFSQIYTINSPYHSLTIYFDAVFGCNFDAVTGYLGYSINNQTEKSVSMNSTVSINIMNPQPTLTIAFQCYGATNNVLDKYCAISHYYIVVHYCRPYCLQCNDEDNCLIMDTYDTSVIILDPSLCSSSQYYDEEYFKCEECPSRCETCLNEIECLTCKYPYQIFITKCVSQCKLNEYFDELTQICEKCDPLCKQCQLKNKCVNCDQTMFRYLSQEQCLCFDGYYDDNVNLECQVCDILCAKCFGSSNMKCQECITVDKVEKLGNTCNCKSGYYFDKTNSKCIQCHNKCENCFSSSDNSCLSCNNSENRILDGLRCSCQTGYFELNDICESCPSIENSSLYQCYKQCGDNSTIWFNQVCSPISCLVGFANNNNQCFPICGDQIKNGNEECDDGNNILDDGCYNCRYQCPQQCLNCNQFTILPCPDVCGDGIISGSEECDDGNQIQFDGCFKCKLECQIQCTQCMRGLCYQCLTYGWSVDINSKTCIENCGDYIIVGKEQCDNGYDFDPNDGCYLCKRQCRDDCLRCSSDGITCLECKVFGFQPVSYYCKNICGDGYLAIDPFYRNTEECDDNNLVNFDGCSNECKFQCQTTLCKTCVNNKCLECIDTYQLDQKRNKCIERCNDNVIVGQEKCEDMNNSLYDGCYNCQLSCQPSCQNCTINGCQTCLSGFRLIGNQCQSICGDGLKVPGEDCDDGNLEPFDGCHGCKYSCDLTCLICYFGQCIGCRFGYMMYKGFCEEISSFYNQKIYLEGNLYQINQNRQSYGFNEFCKEAINDACLVCEDNFYLNTITSICQSTCGDSKINGYEQCDYEEPINNIICNQCKFICKEYCVFCLFGLCLQCEEGYFLQLAINQCEQVVECNDIGLYPDLMNNVCYDICGDALISKGEQCEDQNDIPYDGCYKCKYSCHPACPLCILGECVDDGNACSVGYYFDTQQVQCFNICGDGIIALPDEECDNDWFFDDEDYQCQNCKKICNKNCEICDEIQKCSLCNKNYELLNGKCYPKDQNHNLCLIENCKYCEDSQCIICSTDYVLQPFENICQPICGDGIVLEGELCDDGNSINGDGCDTNCKPSSDSQCVNNQCIYVSHPKPQLKFAKEMDNSQIVYLTYDQQIKLSVNYSIQMFINSISSKINDKDANVSFSEIGSLDQESCQDFQMEIKIQYEEIIIDPIFSIAFADLNIITNEFGKISNEVEISIQLPSPNVLSEKQQQITQSLIKFSGYQMKIIAGLIVLSSLSGKFEIIQNQIDVIQQLYYLKYINSRKGQNLIQYFETFKIIQLASFYDFIGFNPSNNLFFGLSYQKSERIFEEDGRNANYFPNFIQISTVFVFAYFTHQSIKILIKYTMNKIRMLKIVYFNLYILYGLTTVTKFSIKNWKNKFSQQFQRLLQALLYEYTISSFLSLIYQDFNQVEGKFSLIVNGVVIYLLIYYLLYQKHSNNKLHIQFTYSCLQKILFGTILIVCFKSTILQIQLCALNEFIYFYHLFKQTKQTEKFELFKKQQTHFNLFVINIMFLINELYKDNPFKIIQIGWIIVALMSSILSITLLVDICKILQPFAQNLIDKLKPQKPIFQNHEILDQIQQRNIL